MSAVQTAAAGDALLEREGELGALRQAMGTARAGSGALVYLELRAQLGEEAFWAALRAFCARFQYGNASSDDLLGTFTLVAGREVTSIVGSLLGAPD